MERLEESHAAHFRQLLQYCVQSHKIDPDLYTEYDVKRGLRDSNGNGVLTGLTKISDVVGYDVEDGKKVPAAGRLYYQGYDIRNLVEGFIGHRFSFETSVYLLLFGILPTKDQLRPFVAMLAEMHSISGSFLRDVILKASNSNIMNALQRCVLTLYTYDREAEDVSVSNVLRQSLQLIAKLPAIAVYSYYAYKHFRKDNTLLIRNPKKDFSIAENILWMLREDGCFTPLEAEALDIALVLHAEHGGGNNSTFTDHVVTSSGTDTYSAIAASIGSLKGPKHGGANLKVQDMFEDIMENCGDWENEEELSAYLTKILNQQAFDRKGLIYGIGHAVYTESDPRAVILKDLAEKLAREKGLQEEFKLYDRVERLSKPLVAQHRRLFKPICANVDFYSGLIYRMLGIPKELFTSIFAISRLAGWSAHRLEELVNQGKIIRPAYQYVGSHKNLVR
ncbi:citrate/2-methylcitrate synthase [Caproiciproducens sp. NJN-50]|nr:citrate/2-methylcitrate synthase [Caproiciproducens sp. NJN-50]